MEVKKRRINKNLGVYLWLMLFAFTASVMFFSTTTEAKSLYVISNINADPTPIDAYNIEPPPGPPYLVHQATHYVPEHGWGGVGISIDTDSKCLFVVYEANDIIELIDAETMKSLGTTTAPGASDLCGIVVDQIKHKVYATDRCTDTVYVYTWNALAKTLTLDSQHKLANVCLVHGIALDETNGLLFVADRASTTIRYFSTTDWKEVGNFVISQKPVGIAIDVKNRFVYTGNSGASAGCPGPGQGDDGLHLLSKYDLNKGVETTLDIRTLTGLSDDNVLGLAVDPNTSRLYITTGDQDSGGSDKIMVFDSNLNLLYQTNDIGDPTGLCVPNVSWNPLNLAKDEIGVWQGVSIGEEFTFAITCDNKRNTDPNLGATDVNIVDTLPEELDFVSAKKDGINNGVYDPCTHTVFWNIGTIPAGKAGPLIELVVKVNEKAREHMADCTNCPGIDPNCPDGEPNCPESDPGYPNDNPGCPKVDPNCKFYTIYNYCTINFKIAGQRGVTTIDDDVQILPYNTLILDTRTGKEPLYIKPGGKALIDMDAKQLCQYVFGCQAILNFSSTYFVTAQSGPKSPQIAAGGGVWDELIYKMWTTVGDLDVAVGVDLNICLGTIDDGTVAKFGLTSTGVEGITRMVFRPDVECQCTDCYCTPSTFFADANARPVYPCKFNSQDIVIDGTPPCLIIAHAYQKDCKGNNVELLIENGSIKNALQGQVDIWVEANDALSGLADIPEVTFGGEPADFNEKKAEGGECGCGQTFTYKVVIVPCTPNGVTAITASVKDKAGNLAYDEAHVKVNKNQITGLLELEDLKPPTKGLIRKVVFVAHGTSKKTWIIDVYFPPRPGPDVTTYGHYMLKDVPDNVFALSAKTCWNLRRKLTGLQPDECGQLVANFVCTNGKLLGGDLNNDNCVNILDFAVLKYCWCNKDRDWADINGDGLTTLTDYYILKRNFFKKGDPE